MMGERKNYITSGNTSVLSVNGVIILQEKIILEKKEQCAIFIRVYFMWGLRLGLGPS